MRFSFIALAFILPYQYVLSALASSLGKRIFETDELALQLILRPEIWILLILLANLPMLRFRNKDSMILLLFFLYCALGLWEFLFTLICGCGDTVLSLSQFVFGFLIPLVIGLFLIVQNKKLVIDFFSVFYLSYALYCIVAIALVFSTPALQMEGLDFGSFLISFRYNYEGSLFHLFVGNSNKQSNYILLMLVLGPILLSLPNSDKNEDWRRKIYCVFALFSVVLLLLLFSRLVIMLLPLVIFINRQFLLPRTPIMKVLIYVSSALLSFFAITELDQSVIIINYLFFSEFIDGSGSNFLGTANIRINQWFTIWNDFSFLGFGVGGYGQKFFGSNFAGTHNLILDHFVSGGIVSLSIVSLILALLFLRSLLEFNFSTITIVLISFLLFAREYSFSYLYVTSLGGIFFVILIITVFRSTSRIKCL